MSCNHKNAKFGNSNLNVPLPVWAEGTVYVPVCVFHKIHNYLKIYSSESLQRVGNLLFCKLLMLIGGTKPGPTQARPGLVSVPRRATPHSCLGMRLSFVLSV